MRLSDDDGPEFDSRLTVAHLDVLQRQGRHEEFLRLAEAAGENGRCAQMLVTLGRIEEAVAFGSDRLRTSAEALALARALRAAGAVEEALSTAQRGMTLEGDWEKRDLARWVSEAAAAMGKTGVALEAALAGLRSHPSLADYQAVQDLAGDRWPTLRGEILDALRGSCRGFADEEVAIFLHEGLIDDAIALADRSSFYGFLEPVVDAAIEKRPDWAIKASKRQAEPIMDRGKSRAYDHAAHWLEKARDAYLASGRGKDWERYLDKLITKHKRKYSLVHCLEGLRTR